MKVPFPANSQNHTKPLSFTIHTTLPITAAAAPTPTPYEPKSVLDVRRSPSPVAQKPVSSTAITDQISAVRGDDPLQLEADHLLNNQHLEGWGSLMRELGLHDDSTSVSKPIPQLTSPCDTQITPTTDGDSTFPELPPVASFDSNQFVPADFGVVLDIPTNPSVPLNLNSNTYNSISRDLNGGAGSWNAGFDLIDELIRLAECFETNSLQLGQVILTRLNQRLSSPTGEPLQRAAFYFKEALQSLLTGSTTPAHRHADPSEIVQTIKAQKTFSSISPIPLFSSFTANQAVLEALDGSTSAHIIDFDIGLGVQWASFIEEFADKADSRKVTPPVLRISAIVSEEYAVESSLIRENLTQFARELNVRFDMDFVWVKTFEYLSFQAIKFIDGEKVAVLLSPAIFRQVGTGFLRSLRLLSPRVVVHVDTEGQMNSGTPSCRQAVMEGLVFYSALLESLEAANFNSGGDWMRSIETFVLFPKIVEVVEAEGRRGMTCKEALVAAGLRQVGVSQFAEFQAECLLRRVQVPEFNVVKRQAEMLLCWHDKPIAAMSAWKC